MRSECSWAKKTSICSPLSARRGRCVRKRGSSWPNKKRASRYGTHISVLSDRTKLFTLFCFGVARNFGSFKIWASLAMTRLRNTWTKQSRCPFKFPRQIASKKLTRSVWQRRWPILFTILRSSDHPLRMDWCYLISCWCCRRRQRSMMARRQGSRRSQTSSL
jgi:hypothetical protein